MARHEAPLRATHTHRLSHTHAHRSTRKHCPERRRRRRRLHGNVEVAAAQSASIHYRWSAARSTNAAGVFAPPALSLAQEASVHVCACACACVCVCTQVFLVPNFPRSRVRAGYKAAAPCMVTNVRVKRWRMRASMAILASDRGPTHAHERKRTHTQTTVISSATRKYAHNVKRPPGHVRRVCSARSGFEHIIVKGCERTYEHSKSNVKTHTHTSTQKTAANVELIINREQCHNAISGSV